MGAGKTIGSVDIDLRAIRWLSRFLDPTCPDVTRPATPSGEHVGRFVAWFNGQGQWVDDCHMAQESGASGLEHRLAPVGCPHQVAVRGCEGAVVLVGAVLDVEALGAGVTDHEGAHRLPRMGLGQILKRRPPWEKSLRVHRDLPLRNALERRRPNP